MDETMPSPTLKLHTMLAPVHSESDGNGSGGDGRRAETNMQVCMHVKHGDLPAGLGHILNRMTEATYSQTAEPEPEELGQHFYWDYDREHGDAPFVVAKGASEVFEAGWEEITDFKVMSSDPQVFTVVAVEERDD